MLSIGGAGVNLNNQSGYRVAARYSRSATAAASVQNAYSPSKGSLPSSGSQVKMAQDGFAPSVPLAKTSDPSNPAGVYKRMFVPEATSAAPAAGKASEPAAAEGASAAEGEKPVYEPKLPNAPDSEGKSPAEQAQEEECETCENRRYQDGSDDPGVSFKTAGKIAKNAAASTIRAHEQEHVSRNAAKAEREGREVVSSSVVLHTGICPECGDLYYAGGTTTTVTRSAGGDEQQQGSEPASAEI